MSFAHKITIDYYTIDYYISTTIHGYIEMAWNTNYKNYFKIYTV